MSGCATTSGYDLVVVTNFLPSPGDAPRRRGPAGSMSRLLRPVVAARGGAWVGGAPQPAPESELDDGVRLHPVPLTGREVADHYHGHCLSTLAPLYVDAGQQITFTRRQREAYRTVNQRIAEAVARIAAPGATVWVQDYHLQLVPAHLRGLRPDVRIGFFLHTPFPPVERFTRQPLRDAILDGLLGADLIGFQQQRSASNFLAVAEELGGWCHDSHTVRVDGRRVAVRVLPSEVDGAQIEALAGTVEVAARADTVRATVGDPRRVLLSVGSADPADGVGRRLDAYAQLLAEGRIDPLDTVLIHLAACGDEDHTARQFEHDTIDRMVAQINGMYARLGHPVLHYLRPQLDFPDLVAMYRAADVLLATPLHQGMTLAAKEFVATRTDDTGRIVLSEFSGAAGDLPEADIVNPHDMEALKDAIEAAARAARKPEEAMAAMRQRLRGRDVQTWADAFLTALATVARRNQPDLATGRHP